jgi:hypothetical protein
VKNRRVLPHARRFQQARLKLLCDWSMIEPDNLFYLAALYKQHDMNVEAEEMCVRALRGKEKAWGPEHTSTLDAVNAIVPRRRKTKTRSFGERARAQERYSK